MQKCEACTLSAACVPIGMERLLGDDWFSICVKCRAVWRHEKGDSSYTGGMNGRCHRVTGHCPECEAWLRKHRPLLEDCPACRSPGNADKPRCAHHVSLLYTSLAGVANVANVAASLPTPADEGGYHALRNEYPKEIVYTKFMMHYTGGQAWREERGQVVMIPITRK